SSVHGCAELQNNAAVGLTHFVSSRVPAMINVVPAYRSAFSTRTEAQVGQKRRVSGRPASPRTVYSLVTPVMLNASSGTMTASRNAEPVCRWQSVQQHI